MADDAAAYAPMDVAEAHACEDCGSTHSPLYVGPWHEVTCPHYSPAWEPLTQVAVVVPAPDDDEGWSKFSEVLDAD